MEQESVTLAIDLKSFLRLGGMRGPRAGSADDASGGCG